MLIDQHGRTAGIAPKIPSHHTSTPLHLGFSCYLADPHRNILITRRAAEKKTFPSVITNSCCGHPAPGESLREAVTRRVRVELGVIPEELTLVLPDYRYHAVAPDGVAENEICPVVRARCSSPVRFDAAEVADAVWCDWDECQLLAGGADASPWFRDQMMKLVQLGRPGDWPAADPALLAPAITW